MDARTLGSLALVTVLLSGAAVSGQSRGQRGQRGPSRTPANAQPAADAPGAPGTPIPPAQGYVIPPAAPTPGTAPDPLIPSDGVEISYWELYDRERQVTVSGRVTRVDWTQPNTYIFMTASGVEWVVESSFIRFRQSGATPAVGTNQTITVSGFLPKDEMPSPMPFRPSSVARYLKSNHLMRAVEITTVYGQKLVMGQPPSEIEIAERVRCRPLGC